MDHYRDQRELIIKEEARKLQEDLDWSAEPVEKSEDSLKQGCYSRKTSNLRAVIRKANFRMNLQSLRYELIKAALLEADEKKLSDYSTRVLIHGAHLEAFSKLWTKIEEEKDEKCFNLGVAALLRYAKRINDIDMLTIRPIKPIKK